MFNKILNGDLNYILKNIKNKKYFFNKKILITGSNGFIGFYLTLFFIKYFKKLGISKLYLIDKNKIKYKTNEKNIIFLKKDILDFNFTKMKFDIIIHAASIASPTFYRKFPLETCDANVYGLRKILEYGKIKKKTSILFFSSSEIYGEPNKNNIPTKESYRGNVSCVGPRACYDESKRYCETLCYIYAKYFNVSVKVVRPFNNYGPGLKIKDGRAPADFANSITNKKDIILYSNGKATRSFCYISDSCIGYINVLPLKKYVVLNIGNNQEISILALAKLYRKIGKKFFNYNKSLRYKKSKDVNYNVDSPNRRCPDINLAKKIIQFKPSIKIENGIKRYLEFLNN